MSDSAFRAEQRAVAGRMALAAVVTLVLVGASLAFGHVAPLVQRITIAAVVAVSMAAWLGLGIANVARLRFLSADDIAGAAQRGGTPHVRDASAILQNTLEQVALAIPVQFGAAIVIDRSAALLTASGLAFALGRGLFWSGYARGAKGRALGFALTFYPTMAVLLATLAAIARRIIA